MYKLIFSTLAMIALANHASHAMDAESLRNERINPLTRTAGAIKGYQPFMRTAGAVKMPPPITYETLKPQVRAEFDALIASGLPSKYQEYSMKRLFQIHSQYKKRGEESSIIGISQRLLDLTPKKHRHDCGEIFIEHLSHISKFGNQERANSYLESVKIFTDGDMETDQFKEIAHMVGYAIRNGHTLPETPPEETVAIRINKLRAIHPFQFTPFPEGPQDE